MSALSFFHRSQKKYPPVIVRSSSLSVVPKKVNSMSEAEVRVRCDAAMKFIGAWNHDGPWILRATGEAKKFYADDIHGIRSFVSKRIMTGKQVDMFLPSADTFLHGDAIPVSDAGLCDTICLEMRGRPRAIRCESENLGWPPSSASLLTSSGMIMLWRISPATDWITGSEVSKLMALRSYDARHKRFCPLPGVSKGVVFLDMYQDDKYNLNDFLPPSVPEKQVGRPEIAFRPLLQEKTRNNNGEIRFPGSLIEDTCDRSAP